MRARWGSLSLRSKMFFAFGALILLAAVVISIYSASLAVTEMDAYMLGSLDRNLRYVGREIEGQLHSAGSQAILFAGSAAVSRALTDYDSKEPLAQWEGWRELQAACNYWMATNQLSDIRIHIDGRYLFLRDGQRYIPDVAAPEALRERQGNVQVLWDMFSVPGLYSCYAPIVAGWRQTGYVELRLPLAPLLRVMDTQLQTGMTCYLTDGDSLMNAAGELLAMPAALKQQPLDGGDLTHIHHAAPEGKLLYTVMKLEGYPLCLIGEMPAALISASSAENLRSIALILALVLAIAFLLAWRISRSICSRLEKLKVAMATVRTGQLAVKVDETYDDEMGQILKTFNSMAADLKVTTETALINERVGREAELRLMQAQINPHFIYNTLESISWADANHDTERVQFLVRNLSGFLRANLSKTHQNATVAGEIAAIRAYWNIQSYRFGDGIRLEIEAAPECMGVSLMPLLIQPMVENALLHGILPKPDREGCVRLRVGLVNDLLLIEVEDDGVGIAPDALRRLRQALESQTEGSYGLWNVHQRVRAQFGDAYGLSVQSEEGNGTLCILTLPVTETEKSKSSANPEK